jgi:hypothetical protein
MMGEVIKFGKAKKVLAKQAATAAAAENRAKFGRTKGQKTIEAKDKARADKTLDDAKREEP